MGVNKRMGKIGLGWLKKEKEGLMIVRKLG